MGPRLKQMLLSSLRSVSSTTTANQVTFTFRKSGLFLRNACSSSLGRDIFLSLKILRGATHIEILLNIGFITKTILRLQSRCNPEY